MTDRLSTMPALRGYNNVIMPKVTDIEKSGIAFATNNWMVNEVGIGRRQRYQRRVDLATGSMKTGSKNPWGLKDSTDRFGNRIHNRFVEDSLGNDVDLLTDRNSFHRAMKPVLVIAECFGLMPVHGITGPNATALRFRWRSLRVLYSVCVICCVALLTLNWAFVLFFHSMHLGYFTTVIFYGTCLINMILFMKLAQDWPCLMTSLHKIEHTLQQQYGYPKTLSFRVRRITFIVLTAAFVEHALALGREFKVAMMCAPGSIEWLHIYFIKHYQHTFSIVPFSYVMGFLLLMIDNLATFAWNFMDLFVMLVSVMLSLRFKQINARLKESAVKQITSQCFWRQLRQEYALVGYAVSLVDATINKITLLSFWNNLYFVCVQLYHSIQDKQSKLEDLLYFYLSFGYLLVRFTTVCLYAAGVHEESKRPASVLYSVPADCYCDEVHRFIVHVTGKDVALTALDFFAITRALLLTVFGTIVTYEVVMVQLNEGSIYIETNTTSGDETFRNPFCPDIIMED